MAKKKKQKNKLRLVELGESTLGGRILVAREARNLSPAQLATRIGVLTKTIKNWENDNSKPRTNKLQMLAGVLNVPPMWLLAGGDAFGLEANINVEETAGIAGKLDRLVELHQQSAKLIYELQSEVCRLQSKFDI